MSPRVTVLVPTYNWSSVLPYSLGSVLRQSFTDFELLVIGDGCTDDSESVVASLGDPRVRWINLPENTRHQSAPNNEGLRQAKGELIAYLGHDDLWLPQHLAVMVETLEATASDLVYSMSVNVAADGESVWPAPPRPEQRSYAPPLCIVHRKSVTDRLGGWRDYRELRVTPDVELWQRMEAAGCRLTFVPRLTGIKFPASWRRDVYKTRPHRDQAAWLSRIDATPDLEQRLLVGLVAGAAVPSGIPYLDLFRRMLRETRGRIRMRLALPTFWFGLRPRRRIDAVRRFKGL